MKAGSQKKPEINPPKTPLPPNDKKATKATKRRQGARKPAQAKPQAGKASKAPNQNKTRGKRIEAAKVNPVGRPRGEHALMPIFDTMAQCAAATGVPLSALKMAKAGGCDAFRHGRVEFEGFIRWFFSQEVDAGTDWVKENKRLDALIKRVKLEELKKRVIDFSKVNRFLQELVSQAFFGELDRMTQEFPPALKGRDETAIQSHLVADIEKVKKDLAAKLQAWGGVKAVAK